MWAASGIGRDSWASASPFQIEGGEALRQALPFALVFRVWCFVFGFWWWAHLLPSGGVRGDFPRVGGVETVPFLGCGAHSSPKPQCPKSLPPATRLKQPRQLVPADLVQSRKVPLDP